VLRVLRESSGFVAGQTTVVHGHSTFHQNVAYAGRRPSGVLIIGMVYDIVTVENYQITGIITLSFSVGDHYFKPSRH
jgi:hypothetical protein